MWWLALLLLVVALEMWRLNFSRKVEAWTLALFLCLVLVTTLIMLGRALMPAYFSGLPL